MPDDDVSHAVNARLTRLEENAGLPPIDEAPETEEPEEPEEPDEQ